MHVDHFLLAEVEKYSGSRVHDIINMITSYKSYIYAWRDVPRYREEFAPRIKRCAGALRIFVASCKAGKPLSSKACYQRYDQS